MTGFPSILAASSGDTVLLDEALPWVFFLFGLVIGSFLNVVIYRLPRDRESISRGRSKCPSCGQLIRWYQNIPVLSYVALRGRCSKCRQGISLRYPLVEIVTAALFWLVGSRVAAVDPEFLSLAGLFFVFVHLLFVSALVAGTFIDFEFRILPDRITISGMILAPILSTLVPSLHAANTPQEALARSILGVATGAGVILGIGWLGKLLFKKDAMGFGDVKFLGMIGGILGAKFVLLTLMASSIFGSVFGVLWLLIKKDHYIPFGPFLAMGALVMLLYRSEIQYFITVTYPGWLSQVIH